MNRGGEKEGGKGLRRGVQRDEGGDIVRDWGGRKELGRGRGEEGEKEVGGWI